MKKKFNLTILQRLVIGFGSITLLVLISFIITFVLLQISKNVNEKNVKVYNPSEVYLNKLTVLLNDSKLLIRNWVFVEKQTNTPDKNALVTLQEKDFPKLKDTIVYLSSYWNSEQQTKIKYLLTFIKDTIFAYNRRVMERLNSFESYDDPAIVFEVNPLVSSGGEVLVATDKALNQLKNIQNNFITLSKNSNKEMIERANWLSVFLLVIIIIVVVIAAVVGFLTVVSITRPIEALKHNLLQKSKGIFIDDVTKKRNDEIGEMIEALNFMSKNIRHSVESIRVGANILAESSKALSTSANSIAEGANEQAASTEEVSSSMEEMTASIEQNSDYARQTEQLAQKVSDNFDIINKSFSQTADAMQNIASKILVINDIAKRIDLLAINAAIEAARAGEHGKGFAVVASEVRNLAESSQKAANQIDEVSKNSVHIANKSKDLLNGVFPDLQKTLKFVQEISAASFEQNSGINQVNSAIQQLSGVTQNSLMAAEELSVSANELMHQSQKLTEYIAFFKTKKETSDDVSINEIQEHIEKLQLLLLKRKNKIENDNTISSENKVNDNIFEQEKTEEQLIKEKKLGYNFLSNDSTDKEFDKF